MVVAVPCSWLAVERDQARKQREAVDEIKKAGGTVLYDYQFDYRVEPFAAGPAPAKPFGPAWLRNVLGGDLLADVTNVYLPNSEVSDTRLEHLKRLPQLQVLNLNGTTAGDDEMEILKGLTQLRGLYLRDTKVSDAGLEHLKGLTQLQLLSLDHTKVSDVGLEHLMGLPQLHRLELDHTKVSNAGLEYLKGLPRLQSLYLGGNKVGDAGMQNLMGLTQLNGWTSAAPKSATPG